MNESNINEYGEQKSLQLILEELATYCFLNCIDYNNIRVILPRMAIKNFSTSFYSTNHPELKEEKLVRYYTNSAVVHLHVAEDNEKAIKELV